METVTGRCTSFAIALSLGISLFGPAAAIGEALSPDYPIPYQSITVQEESTIERTALIALRHVSQARAELHRNQGANARQEMTEADRLIYTIRDYLSPAAARDLIQIARRHLEYEKPQSVVRDLPAIHAALDRASVYLPTDKAKSHLSAARKLLQADDKAGADREFVQADQSLVVEIEPALARSQQYLKEAQEQMAAGDAGKADAGLKSAEQQMTAVYTGMSSFLFQAKQNLWLALRYQAVAGKYDLGRFLGRARELLLRAAVGGNTTGKVEAGKLADEVLVAEQKISREGKLAASSLRALYEKCAALADRSAQYLAAGLTETATALLRDNDLIEARLHVSYAQTFQITTGEAKKAITELAVAHRYLSNAARKSGITEPVQKQIRSIDDILRSLKNDTTKKDQGAMDSYTRAKGELDALIQKM